MTKGKFERRLKEHEVYIKYDKFTALAFFFLKMKLQQ